ncbi:choline sulfatase [Histoplasma capsulatum var. duboisii H88]|uniref:Choline sulfatase n=1 Tax=Ajellomyces capsulatus (strain H88) TaxID=544711 RepID=A0A8A1LVB6_AJEC8|nr:choline sulfatase [Histoplasma capsulatum var. duboisii H88]
MADRKKPNLLYIMADQMAAPLLSLYDKNSPIKTPTLDRLAREGVCFESAYCNSPLCAPSRFTMVTGQLPSRIGGYDNASDLSADTPTYAHYLRRQGYHTALAGKMHFAGPDQLHGYEQRLTSDIYPGDYGWTVNWDEPEVRPDWYHDMSSVMEAGPCVRTNQLDYDDEVIYKSTQYLYDHARHRREQPFCLTVSMTHPHDPYAMTKEYWDLYEDVVIPLPKTSALPHDKQDPHSQRVLRCIDLFGKEIPEERIVAARRAYFAACSYVDAQVGKLMETLKACDFADETIVVFTGDHGDMLGERGLWYKMVWYEHAARVPMFVHAPGRYKPKRVKENVSTMDLLPTFVEMTGGEMNNDLPVDGVSLMPYILDENSPEAISGVKTDTVIGEYMAEGTLAPVVMIRRGPWKFVYSPIDPPMLYNVESDPAELINLATGVEIPTRPHLTRNEYLTATATIPQQGKPLQTGPAAPPTPSVSPPPGTLTPNVPVFSNNKVNATQILTPPRTPTPTAASASTLTSPSQTDIGNLLSAFISEAHSRWDFQALQSQVLHSQRRRRLVYSALVKGQFTSWDYSPVTDGSAQFIRNHGKGALGDVELLSRYPRVIQWGGNGGRKRV